MATSTNARKRSAYVSTGETPTRVPQQPKPSKIKRLFRTLLLVLIVIAASVGATLYYTWPAGSSLFGFLTPATATQETIETTAQPVQAAPPVVSSEKPIFTILEPFTVTLNDGSSRSRILHVAITLLVNDENSHEILRQYMPMVRDRVLKILAEQHPTYVQTPEGRAQLVDSLMDALSSSYGLNPTVPRINNVLFTAFVIQ